VFDRHGERASRHKARIKFLIQKIGIDAFSELVKEEQKAVDQDRVKVDTSRFDDPAIPSGVLPARDIVIKNPLKFELWKNTNVQKQKQDGYRRGICKDHQW
jgi:sulfite reductase (ferredoxin)